MTTKKAAKPPVDHGPLLSILIKRTGEAAAKYKNALKPKPTPKLSEKAQALQDMVNNGDFGCHSTQVAAAFAIITGEPIQPKPREPQFAAEDMRAGVCIVLHKEDSPYPAGKVLITTQNRFEGLMRTDTGTVKPSYVTTRLKDFRFATPQEIRDALASLSKDKGELLTWACLKS